MPESIVGPERYAQSCWGRWVQGLCQSARNRHRRRAVADDDINDAFAALWTAERILKGSAKFAPEQPTYDSLGLRMEMWY